MVKRPEKYAPTVLRLALGLLFIIPGIMKLIDPAGITGLLTNLGVPAPTFVAWIVLLSEIIFGAAVLIGYKLKYSVWPLVIILAVAATSVVYPTITASTASNLFFHILGIAGLVSLSLTGPGAWAVEKKWFS